MHRDESMYDFSEKSLMKKQALDEIIDFPTTTSIKLDELCRMSNHSAHFGSRTKKDRIRKDIQKWFKLKFMLKNYNNYLYCKF